MSARELKSGLHPFDRMRAYGVFFTQFCRHYHDTGALTPSGAALARAMTEPLACAGGGPLRVLDVGAGTGVFTAAILRHLRAGDRLDVYEINPAFRPWIEARLRAADSAERGIDCKIQIAPVESLADEAPEECRYDFIVSGLPFNNFPALQVRRILDLLMGRLRPGGVLSYFEYAYIRDIKRSLVADAAERARLANVGAVVGRFQRRHPYSRQTVLLNVPPAMAHFLRNPAG